MRPLSAAKLLDVWERGAGSSPATQALLLLAAVSDAPPDQLASLPVGQRDARLLELRERTFGPQLSCLATCPACRENLECDLNVSDLLVADQATASNVVLPLPRGEGEGWSEGPISSFSFQSADYSATFRLPTSEDLASLSPEADVLENRNHLFLSCLLSASHSGEAIAANELPSEVATAVVERMAELDPQADLQLRLDCPECGHRWETSFDIVSFLRTEIHAAATRLLREVHEIASAYHWPEADILAMTPVRRQVYLELIRG